MATQIDNVPRLIDATSIPARIRSQVDESQHLAILGGRGLSAHSINLVSSVLNLADARSASLGVEARAIVRGGGKLSADPRTAEIVTLADEKRRLPGHVFATPTPIAEAVHLADAVASSTGRSAGQGAVMQVPGTGVTAARIALSAPQADLLPLLGQDLFPVVYVEGYGKAQMVDSMAAVPRSSAQVTSATVKIRTIALMSDVDPLRSAKAMNSIPGLGFDLARHQELADRDAMAGALRNAAILGDAGLGLNGITSVTGTGKGVDIDKTSVTISSATAADIRNAVGAAIDAALAAADGHVLDTVTIDQTIAGALRRPASSGGSELEVLIKAYQSAGIVNWYEQPNLLNASGNRCVCISNVADMRGPRMLADLNPLIFTFPKGAQTETYYLHPFGGVWAGISAFHYVARFTA